MVVVRLDAQDTRLLGGAEADREERPERDRHLAEEVADLALADYARDAVDELDRLDLAVEHREERAIGTLVGGVLARSERDVRRRAREPLPIRVGEPGEDRDRPDLLPRDHGSSLAGPYEGRPRGSSATNGSAAGTLSTIT